jgi:hypothetical protein
LDKTPVNRKDAKSGENMSFKLRARIMRAQSLRPDKEDGLRFKTQVHPE